MEQQSKRAAVVINPTKVDDKIEKLIKDRFDVEGWAEPLWLETSAEDPGRQMTAEAVAADVDLVVAAGGDGTVRVVLAGLVGSDIPCVVMAAGTTNLLARNLGLPLKLDRALEAAFSDDSVTIDLIKLTADDREPDHFAVMAGMGIDAATMAGVDEDLKKTVGPAAYAVAAARNLGNKPQRTSISIDNGRRHHRRPALCVIGNVGELPGLLSVLPDAAADDGKLDVLVVSSRRIRDWIATLVRVLLRRHREDGHTDVWSGRRVEFRTDKPEAYQMDGDTEGEARRLVAEVVPQAVAIKRTDAS